MAKPTSTPSTPAQAAGLPLTPDSAGQPALFVVLAGRGGTGKTLLLRWVCERALAGGRSMVIADGDRTNRSLPLFLDGVLSPPNAGNPAVMRWLEAILVRMIEQRFHLGLDLGGGDLLLKQMALELDLQSLLEAQGLTPVILHLIGPEVETLSYLASLEEGGLFTPERTALALNEGLVPPGHDAEEVFGPVKEHPVFREAVRRGARPVLMPALIPAYEVNRRRLSFADAAAGKAKGTLPPLSLFDQVRTRVWQRRMEEAMAPILGWLP